MKQVNPGSVKIYETKLLNSSGTIGTDILPQIKMVSLFESIMAPTLSCEILMEDAIDLHKNFPITGEEKFKISFKTDGVDNITTLIYHLHKTAAKKDISNSKVSSYILKGISPEMTQTIKKGQVSDSYQVPIHDIVTRIMKDKNYVNTNKSVYVEKTKGLDKIILPSLFLFQGIDYLRGRAISAETKNSSFVFFENQFGFHFRTIESLMLTKRDDYGSKEYFLDNTPTMYGKKSEVTMFRNIITMEKKNVVSTIKNIAEGYRNQVNSFDIITKRKEATLFDFTKSANEFISSDKLPTLKNTNEFFADLMNLPDSKGKQMFVPKDATKVSEFLTDSLGQKMAYGSMFNDSISLKILVFGDSTLTVGDTIKLNIKSNPGTTGKPSDEAKLAGMYLIVALRHLISPGMDPLHHTALEIVKMGAT